MAQSVTVFGEWWEHKIPFRHYRASNVLAQEDYLKISSNFMSLLKTPNDSGENISNKFHKSKLDYDAFMLGMDEEIAPMFSPFFTEEFLKSLAKFVSIPFIARIEGGLHSNNKNSRTGWIHSDHCSAWFDESIQPAGNLLFPRKGGCDYFTGKIKKDSARPVEYVRAATLIYYLCNDGWKPGDGGETGIYGAAKQDSITSYALVPPVNNTLLLFECSPHSYHRFVNNPGRTRNSIILWLHSTPGFAESIWGKSINRRASK